MAPTRHRHFVRFRSPPPPAIHSLQDLEFTRRIHRSWLIPTVTSRLPVRYKGLQPGPFYDVPDVSLSAVAGVLGLGSDSFAAAIQEHDRLLRVRGWMFGTVVHVLGMAALFGFFALESVVDDGPGLIGWLDLAQVLAPALLGYATVRLLALLTNRGFADSLAAASVVNLLLELSRDDALSSVAGRKAVLYRIRALSRATVLLGLKYSAHATATDPWSRQHFSALDAAIRERERWAIAPGPGTRTALYDEVQRLAPMYILGEFGRFTWSGSVPAEEPKSVVRRVLAETGRVLALALPLLFFWYLLSHPEQVREVGISGNVVGLFFIAWILFSFDTLLKLGVVANVVALAKGIKELK